MKKVERNLLAEFRPQSLRYSAAKNCMMCSGSNMIPTSMSVVASDAKQAFDRVWSRLFRAITMKNIRFPDEAISPCRIFMTPRTWATAVGTSKL